PIRRLHVESAVGPEDAVDRLADAAGMVEVFNDESHRDDVEELVVERELTVVEVDATVVGHVRPAVEDIDPVELGMGIQAAEVRAIRPGAAPQVEDPPGILEAGHESPARVERAAKPAITEFSHRRP